MRNIYAQDKSYLPMVRHASIADRAIAFASNPSNHSRFLLEGSVLHMGG
jgi:hypothetical protein